MFRSSPLPILLLALFAAAALAAPAPARAQADRYLSAESSLTDNDFLLYFQFMELNRQDVDEAALGSFARQNGVEPEALASLANRVNIGQLIIENPGMAESMVATYGPAVNPSDRERALFQKYADQIRRYRSGG
jgi:hypothetical protein